MSLMGNHFDKVCRKCGTRMSTVGATLLMQKKPVHLKFTVLIYPIFIIILPSVRIKDELLKSLAEFQKYAF